MSRLKHLAKPAAALAVAALLTTGCATKNPNDPFENYNRVMFTVNEAFDNVAFKPAATIYKNILPDIVQTGVTNFFGNIADVWTAFNNFLQGEGEKGLSDVTRVTVNTIFGLGGVIDVASNLKLQKHHADFGQTLGVWGMEAGPYVVLPILGPSTLRDTIALPAEWYGDPWTYVDNIRLRNAGIIVRAVNYRAALLDASSLIDDAALDKYEFMRDAFLQRRYRQVHSKDGSDDEWVEVSASEPFIKPESVVLKKSGTESAEKGSEDLGSASDKPASGTAKPEEVTQSVSPDENRSGVPAD